MKFIDCTDLIEPIMFECKTEWFNKSMLFDNIPVRHIMFHAQPSEREREEMRILYVAMTRAIRSFSWIKVDNKNTMSWQKMIWEDEHNAI